MAIELKFNVIILRQGELREKYPGGLEQFQFDWIVRPPQPCVADDHLVAYSSMGWYFADVVEAVEKFGIAVATGNSFDGLRQRVYWLDCNVIDGRQVCWLKGTELGQIESFLSGRTYAIKPKDAPMDLESIRRKSQEIIDQALAEAMRDGLSGPLS